MEKRNILIERIDEIAQISLERKVDWSVALSMWEAEQPELAETVTADDRSCFAGYVAGRADADGRPIEGERIVYALDALGRAVRK